MYDNIRLFVDVQKLGVSLLEIQFIKDRFSMTNYNQSKGMYNNSGNQKLLQNRGVYISYQPESVKDREGFVLQFSLHKFWNVSRGKQLQNYDLFTLANCLEAFEWFCSFFPIDIQAARVLNFEVGVNILLTQNPTCYMMELDCIMYGNRKIRIIESPFYKEYKLFATHMDVHKRAVYVFYDKSEESKPWANQGILRAEKKYNRLNHDLYFNNFESSSIFQLGFMEAIRQEMYKAFVTNLIYKGRIVKGKGVTSKDIEIHLLIEKYGNEGYEEELGRRKKNRELSSLEYYRFKAKVVEYLGQGKTIDTINSKLANQLKLELSRQILAL